jgi:alpha-L-rhamnosidase
VVHLGEKLDAAGRIDRAPGATIRYRCVTQELVPGRGAYRLVIPADERNTKPGAILMPDAIGEVFPFRYAEIENGAQIDRDSIRQVFVHYPFDDLAATFESSSPVLNQIWALCKHTIKATTFCGVYVDGDRERIPYEGDAYINQLGHYCMDREYDFARYSHEYMIQKPTWCTEWHLHSVMMAWMDALYSGETASLKAFYNELRVKTLIDFAREDGLISVDPELRTAEVTGRLEPHFKSGIIKRDIRDVLDWPPGSFTDGGTGERDNHEMLPINTVTNAFHAHVLVLMGQIAELLGRGDDQTFFVDRAARVTARINELLFDPSRGIYIDGEGSSHASLHSNMFMLAFDLVPEERKPSVIAFVKSRGMACSVYGAQHLLEGLYLNREGEYALELMTAEHDRGWWNMLQAGSTMTLEAWDVKYKNNLDWNHAWGAAPGNMVARYLLGVRPLTPGFVRTLIQPQLGRLVSAVGTVPTPLGGITVAVTNEPGRRFELRLEIPEGITARVGIPQDDHASTRLLLNGCEVAAVQDGGTLYIDPLGSGKHVIQR